MINLRLAKDRGYADHGWLQSFHSFSFAQYHDPAHMGYGNLRVINEDWIAPAKGFSTHGHQNMEIVTYVLAGELTHKDSMGNTSTILPGEVQRMTAGTGVQHSEFNHHPTQATHLLQIWILPNALGLPPSYEQKAFSPTQLQGRLCLVASHSGEAGTVHLNANAQIWAGVLGASGPQDIPLEMPLNPQRLSYVYLATGQVSVNGQALGPGDAAKLSGEKALVLSHAQQAHVLVFDLEK